MHLPRPTAALLIVSLVALAGYALLDLVEPALAIDSDPVNLGAEGLALELRLHHWDGTEWAEVDSSGIVTAEIADGDYLFTGLPSATGAERYKLIVATAAAPAVGLAAYVYGARPGETIVWHPSAIAQPPAPSLWKVGDTAGSVQLTVRYGLPATVGDGATTATARLYDTVEGEVVFTGRAATITGVTFDEVTASWGATFAYAVAAGDFDSAGLHRAEFTVCYLGAAEDCHTLPANDVLELHVRDLLGGSVP